MSYFSLILYIYCLPLGIGLSLKYCWYSFHSIADMNFFFIGLEMVFCLGPIYDIVIVDRFKLKNRMSNVFSAEAMKFTAPFLFYVVPHMAPVCICKRFAVVIYGQATTQSLVGSYSYKNISYLFPHGYLLLHAAHHTISYNLTLELS